jgi:hypothetical protein
VETLAQLVLALALLGMLLAFMRGGRSAVFQYVRAKLVGGV